LLELDLVLERFLEKYRDRLQGENLNSFKSLLAYTDDELWNMVRGRAECSDTQEAVVMQWLRRCRDRTDSQ
jgi:succinate dehydrogenase flavin-adding protein (antitoxin of CptAB toxin-antitoxin module)